MAVQDNIDTRQEAKWNLSVNGTDYSDNYRRMYFAPELMQVGEFEIQLFGIDESNSDFAEGNPIEISYDGSTAFRGTIDELDYGTGLKLTIEGGGRSLLLKEKIDKNEFIGSDTDTIVSNIVGSTVGIGTNTQLNGTNGNVDFRTDEEDKITAIDRLVRNYDGEWWMNEDGNGNDQINVDTSFDLNSGNSVKTYDVFGQDKNAIKSGKRDISKDVDVVVVKGYGDGDDQIREQYPDSPGSDPTAFVFTDKTILSSDVADKKAESLYNEMNNWQEIKVKPMQTDEVRKVGETITINDDDTGLSGDYRIVKTEYKLDVFGGFELTLHCSNAPQGVVDDLKETKKENETQTGYGQGNRNTINESNADISDSQSGTVIEFNVPKRFVEDETGRDRTAQVRLDYDVKDYKKLISASDATAIDDSTTTVKTTVNDFGDVEKANTEKKPRGNSNQTVGDFTITDVTNAGGGAVIQEESSSKSYGSIGSSYESAGTFSPTSKGSGAMININVAPNATISSPESYTFEVLVEHDFDNDGIIEEVVGNANNIRFSYYHNDAEGGGNVTFMVPTTIQSGNDIYVNIRTSGGSTPGVVVETNLYIIDEHKHDLPRTSEGTDQITAYMARDSDGDNLDAGVNGDQGSDTLPNTNTVSFGKLDNNDLVLTKETTNASSVDVIVNGNNIGTFNSLQKEDIDITGDVTTPGTNTVEIRPDSKGYVKGNVIVDHKIDSTRS